ncbi:hypothetical protein LV780_21200 (plasmid) [Cereibacter azotoformans]|uniref:hypothetical protein n=1 Tax=Cereibacter azotoformans TaxID=43057 RepID=UPI0011B1FC01|nr:hypothetical protein [Cereibacter azotoformans]UIJ33146.1 hypothetical protein LV780_21200 [Cereibacter azotoformans]
MAAAPWCACSGREVGRRGGPTLAAACGLVLTGAAALAQDAGPGQFGPSVLPLPEAAVGQPIQRASRCGNARSEPARQAGGAGRRAASKSGMPFALGSACASTGFDGGEALASAESVGKPVHPWRLLDALGRAVGLA